MGRSKLWLPCSANGGRSGARCTRGWGYIPHSTRPPTIPLPPLPSDRHTTQANSAGPSRGRESLRGPVARQNVKIRRWSAFANYEQDNWVELLPSPKLYTTVRSAVYRKRRYSPRTSPTYGPRRQLGLLPSLSQPKNLTDDIALVAGWDSCFSFSQFKNGQTKPLAAASGAPASPAPARPSNWPRQSKQ